MNEFFERSLENIEYAQAGGESLRMDAYIPQGPGPFPAVIVVHGGGWVMGDRRTTVAPLFAPLAQAGFAWFSISYRLAKHIAGASEAEDGFASLMMLGTAVEDVRSALAFVTAHAAEYRIDTRRMGLIGESAGAQLACMAVLQKPVHALRAVVLFYGPMDLVTLAKTSKQIPEALRDAVRGTMWEEMLLNSLRELSPVNFVSRDAPPFLLIHGTADALVPFDQSQEMYARLCAAGGECELFPVLNGGHGIRWWEFEKLTAYKPHMIAWLRRHMQ